MASHDDDDDFDEDVYAAIDAIVNKAQCTGAGPCGTQNQSPPRLPPQQQSPNAVAPNPNLQQQQQQVSSYRAPLGPPGAVTSTAPHMAAAAQPLGAADPFGNYRPPPAASNNVSASGPAAMMHAQQQHRPGGTDTSSTAASTFSRHPQAPPRSLGQQLRSLTSAAAPPAVDVKHQQLQGCPGALPRAPNPSTATTATTTTTAGAFCLPAQQPAVAPPPSGAAAYPPPYPGHPAPTPATHVHAGSSFQQARPPSSLPGAPWQAYAPVGMGGGSAAASMGAYRPGGGGAPAGAAAQRPDYSMSSSLGSGSALQGDATAQLRAEMERLRQQLQAQEAATAGFRDAVTHLEREKTELAQRLSAASSNAPAVLQELQNKTREMTFLEQEADELRRTSRQKAQHLAQLEAAKASLERELKQAKDDLALREDELRQARERMQQQQQLAAAAAAGGRGTPPPKGSCALASAGEQQQQQQALKRRYSPTWGGHAAAAAGYGADVVDDDMCVDHQGAHGTADHAQQRQANTICSSDSAPAASVPRHAALQQEQQQLPAAGAGAAGRPSAGAAGSVAPPGTSMAGGGGDGGRGGAAAAAAGPGECLAGADVGLPPAVLLDAALGLQAGRRPSLWQRLWCCCSGSVQAVLACGADACALAVAPTAGSGAGWGPCVSVHSHGPLPAASSKLSEALQGARAQLQLLAAGHDDPSLLHGALLELLQRTHDSAVAVAAAAAQQQQQAAEGAAGPPTAETAGASTFGTAADVSPAAARPACSQGATAAGAAALSQSRPGLARMHALAFIGLDILLAVLQQAPGSATTSTTSIAGVCAAAAAGAAGQGAGGRRALHQWLASSTATAAGAAAAPNGPHDLRSDQTSDAGADLSSSSSSSSARATVERLMDVARSCGAGSGVRLRAAACAQALGCALHPPARVALMPMLASPHCLLLPLLNSAQPAERAAAVALLHTMLACPAILAALQTALQVQGTDGSRAAAAAAAAGDDAMVVDGAGDDGGSGHGSGCGSGAPSLDEAGAQDLAAAFLECLSWDSKEDSEAAPTLLSPLSAAAAAAAAACSSCGPLGEHGPTASLAHHFSVWGCAGVQRRALALLAGLLEQGSCGLLALLCGGDCSLAGLGGGAAGGGWLGDCGLAQRLLELADAACSVEGGCDPLALSYPTPACPALSQVLQGCCAPHAWLQRLRLAHEAMLLLKELLVVSEDTRRAALDDLTSCTESQHLVTLATAKLAEWPKVPPELLQPVALLQPLQLAPWAARLLAPPPGKPQGPPGSGWAQMAPAMDAVASLEAVAQLAASVRRRFVHRLQASRPADAPGA